MQQIRHTIKLINHVDTLEAELGVRNPQQIRSMEIEGIIDTGCMVSIVPKNIVEQLGLPIKLGRGVQLQTASGEKVIWKKAQDLTAEMMGRSDNFNCIVGPENSTMLIGQNIMEELDICVESTGKLYFRDPTLPVASAFWL